MGNTYEITKCPRCDHAFEPDTVMVHRADNYRKAVELLATISIGTLRDCTCPDCGRVQNHGNTCTCINDL